MSHLPALGTCLCCRTGRDYPKWEQSLEKKAVGPRPGTSLHQDSRTVRQRDPGDSGRRPQALGELCRRRLPAAPSRAPRRRKFPPPSSPPSASRPATAVSPAPARCLPPACAPAPWPPASRPAPRRAAPRCTPPPPPGPPARGPRSSGLHAGCSAPPRPAPSRAALQLPVASSSPPPRVQHPTAAGPEEQRSCPRVTQPFSGSLEKEQR